MKKTISIIVALALCVPLFAIHADAALPPVVYGDLNFDYQADILDVTLIQRGLAGITEFGYETQLRADFDRDGEATVLDATWIQRKEAEITIPEGFGGAGFADIVVTSFYADYDSGKAAVGVPVTFTARANCGEEGSTYEFFINGKKVQERSQKNTCTYTFPESGRFDVSVMAYNRCGFRALYHYRDFANHCYDDYGEWREIGRYSDYVVLDSYPYEELGLTGVSWIDLEYSMMPGLEVHATGGSAPYTYSFTIPDMTNGNQYYGTDIGNYTSAPDKQGWELRYDDDNKPYLYHDFSAENTVFIPLGMFAPRSEHTIIVQSKDANGALTETKTLYFNDEIRIG